MNKNNEKKETIEFKEKVEKLSIEDINKQIESLKEKTKENKLIFKCIDCKKLISVEHDILKEVGEEAEKKNFSLKRYLRGISYKLLESDKCIDEKGNENDIHNLEPVDQSISLIIDMIDEYRIAEYKSYLKDYSSKEKLSKKSEIEKQIAELQTNIDQLEKEYNQEINDRDIIKAKLLEELKNIFKEYTGSGNITIWGR